MGPIVGLYLEYEGILVRGDKIFEVTWDEKNKPGEVERFNVGEGDPQRETDARFDLKGLIAWFYDDLEAPEERQIRVNLRVEGRDGQCARVRRVNVEPGPSLDIGPRGGGNRGESGLALSANVSTPSGSRARFTASASAKNVSSEPVEGPIRTAFVTPPGFSVASSCRSGSSGGGVVICNMGVDRGSALQPGRETEKVSVVFESRDIGGVTTFGAIGLLQDGLVGEVFEYVVDTGAALGVTNLRDLAR